MLEMKQYINALPGLRGINKKLAEVSHEIFYKVLGEWGGGGGQPYWRQTSMLVRKREAHEGGQQITCQKPLLMRGISLDCV